MDDKQFLIITLGCFRNEVESDLLRGALNSHGLEETGSLEAADIVLVNTCGFISEACDEGIDTILQIAHEISRMVKRPPLLVVGCMAQRYGADLMREMPEIDGILGADWEQGLERALGGLFERGHYYETTREPRMPSLRRTVDSSESATLLVRVADGCDRWCRFCSIPGIRGPLASRSVEEICDEVGLLASGRYREIVLLAQDLTSYGRDLGEQTDLLELLRRLVTIPEARWLRLLYLQPEGVTPELIDRVASEEAICDYFDIPFQHASSAVLGRMGRTGGIDTYLDLIDRIRDSSPEASIRSTVMVGYPGETEAEFEELERFVEQARFDWLGAFVFSVEEGTAAASLDGQVPSEVALSRYNRVLEIQDRVEEYAVARFAGRRLEVVVDGISEIEPYDLVGRSYREAPVVDGSIYLKLAEGGVGRPAPGDFTEALITGREGLDLVGEID
jgi:ribosomal protein S12 methylthiotransferase